MDQMCVHALACKQSIRSYTMLLLLTVAEGLYLLSCLQNQSRHRCAHSVSPHLANCRQPLQRQSAPTSSPGRWPGPRPACPPAPTALLFLHGLRPPPSAPHDLAVMSAPAAPPSADHRPVERSLPTASAAAAAAIGSWTSSPSASASSSVRGCISPTSSSTSTSPTSPSPTLTNNMGHVVGWLQFCESEAGNKSEQTCWVFAMRWKCKGYFQACFDIDIMCK